MNGWLSPKGDFFDTYNLLTHFEKAEEIVDWENIKFKGKDPLTNKQPWCAERILEILGWIKIGSNEKFDCDNLSKQQADFLIEHNVIKVK